MRVPGGRGLDPQHVEDQGEWERCTSSRRMYLALSDAGKELSRVAATLLKLARQHRARSTRTRMAVHCWKNGLCDEKDPDKEVAERAYLVMVFVSQAFDENVEPIIVGGGEGVVCTVLRREFPLAPVGFRKVGRMTGDPKNPVDFAALFQPVKVRTQKPSNAGRVFDSALVP